MEDVGDGGPVLQVTFNASLQLLHPSAAFLLQRVQLPPTQQTFQLQSKKNKVNQAKYDGIVPEKLLLHAVLKVEVCVESHVCFWISSQCVQL